MDTTAEQKHRESNKVHCYCILCFAENLSSAKNEVFLEINSEEGVHRNIATLVHKYFIEDNFTLEGFICGNCCQQLENFHSFYLRIKEIQWSRKMRSTEERSPEQRTERIDLDLNIKEEKPDEGYNFDHTGDVDGLSNFLNEQFKTHDSYNNGNGLQNRLVDTIVNEFQASSLSGTDSFDCGDDPPLPKRMRRNVTNSCQINQQDNNLLINTPNPELDFLDEEYYEYDKPPDEYSKPAPSYLAISQLEELERLRKENDWLKRHNHQLVVRLKEVRMRNTDLVKINKDLTDKLKSYDPNVLRNAVPSINCNSSNNPTHMPTVNSKSLPLNSVVTDIPTTAPTRHNMQNEQILNKHSSCSGAYTLDNGDVVVHDSLVPCSVMLDIDSVEPGEKFDLKFISKLALALWGHERLAISSVTGRRSNNAGSKGTPSVQLEPEKLSFIKEKVYDRALRETNDRVQATARFDDSRINRLLNIKIQNAKRKKNPNSSAV